MEWDLAPNIIVVRGGHPGSGKSVGDQIYIFIRCVNKVILNTGLCFSTTAFTHSYDYIPKKWLKDKYDEKFLNKYIERLRQLAEEKKLQPNFLILDDMVGDFQFFQFDCSFRTSLLVIDTIK